MLWDRQFGFLKETLVAPVSRMQVMVGRTLGGATVAIIPGHADPADLPDCGVPAAELVRGPGGVSVCGNDAIVFAALGTAIGSGDPGHAGLSAGDEFSGDADLLPVGALFPLTNLPLAMRNHHQA